MIIALVLACTTAVFSYLAAAGSASPMCAGRELLQGYRNGTPDFLAWPLFSFFCLIPIVVARQSQKTSNFLAKL